MNKFILSAAAVLLAVAAPAVASAQTGYVGAVYNDIDSDAGDGEAYGVEGAVWLPGSGNWGFEVDASVIDVEDGDTGYGIVGHVVTRTDQYLFGGFVGFADDGGDNSSWTAGVEANKYYDRVTLAGAVGYLNSDDADVDAYGINVGVSYFVSDNFRLDAGAGWATVDDGADDDDVTSIGVGGEYQLASLPLSFGASYNHAESDGDADVLGVRVRWNFGGGSLLDRDRSGASQADRLFSIGSVS